MKILSLKNKITQKDKTRIGATPNSKFDLEMIRQIVAILKECHVKKCKLFIRFDDANPRVVNAKDYLRWNNLLKWLEISNIKFIYQHERLKLYYKYADKLIENNLAYVCFCKNGDIHKQKRSNIYCKCRKHTVKENKKLWKDMISGEYKEKDCVLRLKTKEDSNNPVLRDWVLFQIIDIEHPKLDQKYHVWPLYDFASTIDDHEKKVSFVIRSVKHQATDQKQIQIAKYLKLKNPKFIYLGKLKTNLFDYDILKYLGHTNFSKINKDFKDILLNIPITEKNFLPIQLVQKSNSKFYQNFWIENIFSEFIIHKLSSNEKEKVARIGFYLFELANEFIREAQYMSTNLSIFEEIGTNNKEQKSKIQEKCSRFFLLACRYLKRTSKIFSQLSDTDILSEDEKDKFTLLCTYFEYWFKTGESLSSYALGNYFENNDSMQKAKSEYKKAEKFRMEAFKIVNGVKNYIFLKKEAQAGIKVYQAEQKRVYYETVKNHRDINSQINDLEEIINLREEAAALYREANREDLFHYNRYKAIGLKMFKLNLSEKSIDEETKDSYIHFSIMTKLTQSIYSVSREENIKTFDLSKMKEYKDVVYLISPSFSKEYFQIKKGLSSISGLRKGENVKFFLIATCGFLIASIFSFFKVLDFKYTIFAYLISIFWPTIDFLIDIEIPTFKVIINHIKRAIIIKRYLISRRISRLTKYEKKRR